MTTQKPFSDLVLEATVYLTRVDPVLAQTIQWVGPCTLQPDPNVFEALIDAIIRQLCTIKGIGKYRQRTRIVSI